MLALVEAVIGAFFATFRPRASLVAENLALRQQLATLMRNGARHRLWPIDRAFWVVLSHVVAMGERSGDREAGDRNHLAPSRILPVSGRTSLGGAVGRHFRRKLSS
jgi:hypothetical protein